MEKIKNKRNGFISIFLIGMFLVIFTTISALSGFAETDTIRPTIVSVSPMNNEINVQLDDVITVKFSETMDYRTINENTFLVYQRTTPGTNSPDSEYRSTQIYGVVTSEGNTATFTPYANEIQPNQIHGNVFTVTITTGARDLNGNSLSRNYVWSFTTGSDPYNTGLTTSQLDQSATPIISPTTPQQPQPPQQSQQTTQPLVNNTQRSSSWLWLMIGALILLTAILIFALLSYQPYKKKTSVINTTNSNKPNPFGDVHPIMDLEGIGPTYKKALNSMGITDTKQLWNANAFNVSKQIGVSAITVKSWQNMAELASVKDIGPQYAELLERSGVHNIRQLKMYNVSNLLKLVQKKQASLKINIQGNTPGEPLIQNWITQAKQHTFAKT